MGPSATIAPWLAVGAATAVGIVAWRLRALSAAAAGVATIMGAIIVVAAGWVWLVPVGVFFVSSTLLGLLPGTVGDHTGPRDHIQVLANGGVALVGVLLMTFEVIPERETLGVFLGALAGANADTWATEIGGRYGGAPTDLVSGQRVESGTSGGITMLGTITALAGAFAVAASVMALTLETPISWQLIAFISVAGWMGAMFDSVLGSVAQKKMRCRYCGENTELRVHCGRPTARLRGFLPPDMVNLGCTLVGAVIGWMWAS